jgi:hypothetical protein
VEGSDTLTKATMVANYEGTYADLIHFLNLVDRSQRLLIIESLAATPQPQGLVLTTTMKFNAFVREGGNAPDEVSEEEMASVPPEQDNFPRRDVGTAPDSIPPGARPRIPARAARPETPPVPVFTPQPGAPPSPLRLPLAGPRVLRDRLRLQRPAETESRTE